jgi:hypothetical protein
MARKSWFESPVFWALFVLITGILFVLRSPVIHGVETWAHRYFSMKGIGETLAWASDDRVGIFAMLFRAILGIIAWVFLFAFAVVAWVFLWGWRLYFLIPVLGGVVARGLRLFVEPFVFRERTATPGDAPPQGRIARPTANPANRIDLDLLVSRRARIESWLGSESDAPIRNAETSQTSKLDIEVGRADLWSTGWGFRRVYGRESVEETLDNRGKAEPPNLRQKARLRHSGM